MAEDLIREATDRFDAAMQAERDNREEALEDLRFLAGEQWDQASRASRSAADGRPARPMLTINRLPQFVRQVTGDIRQNPPAIKIRPVDGSADVKAAELRSGLIRNIEAQSGAERAYTMAAENAVACGYGAFRITAEWADDDAGWDQDLRIRGFRDPFCTLFDPDAKEPCREDSTFAFVSQLYSRDAFKANWPKATPADWDQFVRGCGDQWAESDKVRVAEYWTREEVSRTLLLVQDPSGQVSTRDASDIDDVLLSQWRAEGLILRERKAKGWKVQMRLLTAQDQIGEVQDWAGRWLPLIPVLGDEVSIGERVVRRGLIRDARDPQRIQNIHRSTLAEITALTPKAKIIGTQRQFAGYEGWWDTAATGNHQRLPYAADPSAPPPSWLAPPMPPAAIMQDLAMSLQDLEAVTGIHPANLGMDGTGDESGRAIISRQRKGEVGTYLYKANLEQAVAHAGRILLDLLPHYYDTQRIVRVLGEDGSPDMVTINQPVVGQDGQAGLLNDMSVGRYDVVASTGPSYATRREEEREGILATMQVMPQIAQTAPDLIMKTMDWPGADELRKRLRKTLPPGLAEPEEGDPPPSPPQPDPNMVLAQAEQGKAQAAMQQAQVKAQQAQAEVQLKQLELEIEREKLGLERLKLEIEYGVKSAGVDNAARQTDIKALTAAADIEHRDRSHVTAEHQRAWDNERGVVEHADRRQQRDQDVEHRSAEFQQRSEQGAANQSRQPSR